MRFLSELAWNRSKGQVGEGEVRRKNTALCLYLPSPALSINQPLEDQEDLGTEWSAVKLDGLFVVTIYLMSRFRTNSTAPHSMGSERGFLG